LRGGSFQELLYQDGVVANMTTETMDLRAPITAVDHVRGAVHPRIVIVEYGDFECPICRAAEPGVRMILKQSVTAIQLVYRHFPLESVHPHALMAAEAAEAAAAQGMFWEMHERLMHEGAHLDRSSLVRHAEALGLDMPLFKAALDDEIYRQRVREHVDGGLRSHLRATPGFYVNGRVCDVSGGIHMLADRVRALL
jgi:protein-disulfide isomerase